MANLHLIKEIAKVKNITLEQLAEKVGIQAQSIHLMIRSGSTKIETLEKIAKVLEVPAYIFMDYDVDMKDYQREVILGNQNAFSYFGSSHVHNVESTVKEETVQELLKAKDDIIDLLKSQLSDLKEERQRLLKELQSKSS